MGGAIGDAIGSRYEGQSSIQFVDFDTPGHITDDTQLTLATCESILETKTISPPAIAAKMLEWYNKRKLTGLGSSTLKALRDLQVGAHWALSGRSGEYAAGNGAAMRIAPLAFFLDATTQQQLIRDVCIITHKNDEAYVGCLAIIHALQAITTNKWQSDQSLNDLIIPHLPDTAVRDNLEKLRQAPHTTIPEAAQIVGTSGHVIQSVPFAIFAAQKIRETSFETIISEIIRCGGDTDTNASLAGQIMGAYIGMSGFSHKSRRFFNKIKESHDINLLADELWKISPIPNQWT
jgi:ADP-ribosylglycohydrolase